MTEQNLEEKIICSICHKEIYVWQKTLEHHTSYFPEIIIVIHKSCHMLAHKIARKNNPTLEKDYIRFYGINPSLFCRRRPNWCKKRVVKAATKITNSKALFFVF